MSIQNITLDQVLSEKGSTIHGIDSTASILEASQKMVSLKIGSLLVYKKGDIIGIITERDILQRVVSKAIDTQTSTVEEFMTKNIRSIEKSSTIEEAMSVMTEQKHRHLPVVEDDKIVGLISAGDLIKKAMLNSQMEVEHLLHYITDSCSSYAA